MVIDLHPCALPAGMLGHGFLLGVFCWRPFENMLACGVGALC